MEALALDHKSLSLSKQIKKNQKRKTQIHNHHHHHHPHQATNMMISRQASAIDQNFVTPSTDMEMMMMMMMMHGHHGGVFLNPHPFSRSSSLPPNYPHHPPLLPPQNHHHQPPLLPLPTAGKPSFLSLPPLNRRHSFSPTGGNTTTRRANSKKPVGKNPNSKEHVAARKAGRSPSSEKDAVDPSNKRVGPDPDSIFSLSPPPSSLPLPRFSLRQPKRSCTVEAVAAEVDDGAAADNLCRMLRLR